MLKGRSLMRLFELQAEGYGYREIARRTGHSRNTVRRYLRDGAGARKVTRPRRGSKLDPYKAEIDRLVADGLTSAPAIMERIAELGYTGKVTIVRDYVHTIRHAAPPKPVPIRRYETPPGHQLQVDWGIFSYIDARDEERRIPGLVATLGYSRRTFVTFAPSADSYGFIGALLDAFCHFGGITNVVLTDHMKTVVIGGDAASGYEYHPQLLDLARYLGISISLCRVRRPETKGKVERSIRYAKEHFWPARHFVDLADLNEQARRWSLERDHRLHPSLGATPMEVFDRAEREALRPLPPRAELDAFVRRPRQVSLDGFVSFGGINYGVPIAYVTRTVWVLPRARTLEITDETGKVIATHSLGFKTRTVVYLPQQYQGIPRAELAGALRGPRARQLVDTTVEVRSLEAYEALSHA